MNAADARPEADPLSDPATDPTRARPRSRARELLDGIRDSAVVPEDAALIQTRASQYYYTLKPQNYFQSWLVDQVAVLTIRIDRSERIERRLRDRASLRAELAWDDDRAREVEALGARLAGRNAESLEALRGTRHGCDWLMRRWAMLAHAADAGLGWTPDQRRLAFDLLGTPPEFRAGGPGATLDEDGRALDDGSDPAAVARRQIAGLRARRERLADLDDADRALVEADLFDDPSPEIRRLRRHEAALHRRARWCLAQLKYESPHIKPHPDLVPRWLEEPEAEPEAETEPTAEAETEPTAEAETEPTAPEAGTKPFEAWRVPSIHPPFDLEPDEIPAPDQPVDLEAILRGRRRKREAQAEGRRDARRRKLERLRA